MDTRYPNGYPLSQRLLIFRAFSGYPLSQCHEFLQTCQLPQNYEPTPPH